MGGRLYKMSAGTSKYENVPNESKKGQEHRPEQEAEESSNASLTKANHTATYSTGQLVAWLRKLLPNSFNI